MSTKAIKFTAFILFAAFVSLGAASLVFAAEKDERAAHKWTELCFGLVAHAGGGVDFVELGGNSRDAMLLSYESGHKVFEFDFNLTTDGQMAAVHDWESFKGPMSAAQWAQIKVYGNLTSMMLDDILDFMTAHKDMYIITDTKSYDLTDNETSEQFRLIVERAKKKDPTLGVLNRIIPQIYNRPMYNIVTALYKFPSIIYTLYQSPDTDKEALDFVVKHSDIKAVTMMPWKANKTFVKNLSAAGKYVYLHTVNDLDEMKAYKERGIHGFYTDFAYPSGDGVKVRKAPTVRQNGAQKGDLPVYVGGEVLPSILIDDEVYVFTADLANYGYNVIWDGSARTVTIAYDKKKKITPLPAAAENADFTWVYSNIRAVVNGEKIEKTYHIGGKIAVPFSALTP